MYIWAVDFSTDQRFRRHCLDCHGRRARHGRQGGSQVNDQQQITYTPIKGSFTVPWGFLWMTINVTLNLWR
jgi:mono/diheme cytochrome c family protein